MYIPAIIYWTYLGFSLWQAQAHSGCLLRLCARPDALEAHTHTHNIRSFKSYTRVYYNKQIYLYIFRASRLNNKLHKSLIDNISLTRSLSLSLSLPSSAHARVKQQQRTSPRSHRIATVLQVTYSQALFSNPAVRSQHLRIKNPNLSLGTYGNITSKYSVVCNCWLLLYPKKYVKIYKNI